jgi:hypothetical protein
LIGEILHWMVNSPPPSSSSANAVMETGPGVISSVIEMLGGPENIPSLGIIPTPWVHPLPDMNCGFHEKHYYQQAIATREWLKRETFVVHYWFHTWVTGAETNMLTDYADVLLSTRGEQVERLFQWELRDSTSSADTVIACALAEFAEKGGEVVLLGEDAFVERVVELLELAGLRPRVRRCGARSEGSSPSCKGVTASRRDVDTFSGTSRLPLLLVSSPTATLDEPVLGDGFEGFVLGPRVHRGRVITEQDGVCLTELCPVWKEVPRVLHLFPSDEPFADAISAHFADHGFSTRRWTKELIQEMLVTSTMGFLDLNFMDERSQELAASLLILHAHGGCVFGGDSVVAAKEASDIWKLSFIEVGCTWLFGCAPQCSALDGALDHWLSARRRSRAHRPKEGPTCREVGEQVPGDATLREFLSIRLRAMYLTGQARDLTASSASTRMIALHPDAVAV